jgi:hypothetical protein
MGAVNTKNQVEDCIKLGVGNVHFQCVGHGRAGTGERELERVLSDQVEDCMKSGVGDVQFQCVGRGYAGTCEKELERVLSASNV